MTARPSPPSLPSLATAKRLVVKIGSALVVDAATSSLRTAWLAGVAADIAALRARGVEVIVVSSGAVARYASYVALMSTFTPGRARPA